MATRRFALLHEVGYDAGMSVLFGIALIIVGTVLAFKGHVLLMVVCVMIGVYPFARMMENLMRKLIGRTEKGRMELIQIDRDKWMKKHHMKPAPADRRRGSGMNLFGDAVFGESDGIIPHSSNTTCPVCGEEVSDDESMCNACHRNVHDFCSRVCYYCDNVYCNDCLADNDYRCLHCGSHTSSERFD